MEGSGNPPEPWSGNQEFGRQVYDWMNNRPERFKISASDAVIQLDLIARVHGVSSAEGFFLNLTNDLKDTRGRRVEDGTSFEQKSKNPTIISNWSTFSTMAAMYIKMELYEKAHECLKKVEGRILVLETRTKFYHVWNNYKSMFPSIPNLGYHAVMSSLVRMNDMEGETFSYVGVLRKANLIKLNFFEHMTEGGECPNSTTWELLSEGHISERRVYEVLSFLEKGFMTRDSKNWKAKPIKLAAFLKLCGRRRRHGERQGFNSAKFS
ncbi:PPR containing plant-like protein, putative [Medicago truncatula]|uniref:PPR containing plant-like protein, putative n=1 Tax=Medicago truncatula TaxID=3880 RepID=G7ILS7_MEDTR|nr:PPR containing plant-like protein, putative [Medicago truncatula]